MIRIFPARRIHGLAKIAWPLLAALFFFVQPALAEPRWEVPAEVSQGRAFLVQVTDSVPFTASITWRDKKIPLRIAEASQGRWEGVAMLAVPIDAKGSLPLGLTCGSQSKTLPIKTLPVPWPEEHLTLAPHYVTPPPEVSAQIKRDQEHSAKVLASLRAERDWALPFQRPVKGSVSGSFGGRRVLNGQPRAPHKGTDMRGPQGTPVLAVADGIVVLAEPQYYSGNVIYLDHGQGVISMYAHLSAFDVTPGESVKRGQTIGKVGATGRVTGPHLHLGVLVQGVAVDSIPLYAAPLAVVGEPAPDAKKTRQTPPAPTGNKTAPPHSRQPNQGKQNFHPQSAPSAR